MITLRPSEARGHFDHGWLDTYHTFSFGDYRDPEHIHFRALRVINEDRVAPGAGFPTHPHRDMEIITVVLSGALEHRDSLGSGEVLRPGEVQVMSAGSGIMHSEFNPSRTEPVHLMQIWIFPERKGLEPAYQQKPFSAVPPPAGGASVQTLASSDGRDGSLIIRQDASLSRVRVAAGGRAEVPIAPGRHAWLHIVRGAAEVNGETVKAGDAVGASEEATLILTAEAGEEFEALLFDLA